MLEGEEISASEVRTFSLDEAPEALAPVATGHVHGKIVVTFP